MYYIPYDRKYMKINILINFCPDLFQLDSYFLRIGGKKQSPNQFYKGLKPYNTKSFIEFNRELIASLTLILFKAEVSQKCIPNY